MWEFGGTTARTANPPAAHQSTSPVDPQSSLPAVHLSSHLRLTQVRLPFQSQVRRPLRSQACRLRLSPARRTRLTKTCQPILSQVCRPFYCQACRPFYCQACRPLLTSAPEFAPMLAHSPGVRSRVGSQPQSSLQAPDQSAHPPPQKMLCGTWMRLPGGGGYVIS